MGHCNKMKTEEIDRVGTKKELTDGLGIQRLWGNIALPIRGYVGAVGSVG